MLFLAKIGVTLNSDFDVQHPHVQHPHDEKPYLCPFQQLDRFLQSSPILEEME